MLRGVAFFLAAFGDEVQDDVFVDRLGNHSAREITRSAKERRNGTNGYAESMLVAYNNRSKSGLQIRKLYDVKPTSATPTQYEIMDKYPADQIKIPDAGDGLIPIYGSTYP